MNVLRHASCGLLFFWMHHAETLAIVEMAHLRICQATGWQWRNNSVHFKDLQTSLLYTIDRCCVWKKINHSRGGLDGYGVSVMPRRERRRCSGQVWIHRDESWKRSWTSQQGERFWQRQPPCYWAARALWALSSAVTQWCIYSITSWKWHLLNVLLQT